MVIGEQPCIADGECREDTFIRRRRSPSIR